MTRECATLESEYGPNCKRVSHEPRKRSVDVRAKDLIIARLTTSRSIALNYATFGIYSIHLQPPRYIKQIGTASEAVLQVHSLYSPKLM